MCRARVGSAFSMMCVIFVFWCVFYSVDCSIYIFLNKNWFIERTLFWIFYMFTAVLLCCLILHFFLIDPLRIVLFWWKTNWKLHTCADSGIKFSQKYFHRFDSANIFYRNIQAERDNHFFSFFVTFWTVIAVQTFRWLKNPSSTIYFFNFQQQPSLILGTFKTNWKSEPILLRSVASKHETISSAVPPSLHFADKAQS